MLCGSRVALLACFLLGSAGCGRARYQGAPRDAGLDAPLPVIDAHVSDAARDVPAALDAPLPDAGSARDALCGRATTLTCLDFEETPPSPWAVYRTATAPPLSYEVRPEFRGRALQVNVGRSMNTGVRFPITDPELIRTGLYVSLHMRLTRPTTTGFLVLAEFNGARLADFSKISIDSDAAGRFQIAATGGGGGPLGPFPTDRWVCVRFEVSSTRAFAEVDGVTTEVTPPSDVGNFQWLAIGAAAQRDTVEVFYDDIVVSTEPVPCLPM